MTNRQEPEDVSAAGEPRDPSGPDAPAQPWWARPDGATATSAGAPTTPVTSAASWTQEPHEPYLPGGSAMYPGAPTMIMTGPSSQPKAKRQGLGLAAVLVAVIVASSAVTGVVVHEVDGPGSTVASRNTILTSTGAAPTSATTGDVHSALATISPSVVIINTVIGGSTSTFGGGFGGGFGQTSESGTAAGTGIIESADGVIVTNAHVIADATSIKVSIPGHGTVSAHVLGANTAKDLAAIKVDGFTDLKPAVFANSADVQVGDQVLAVGNAEGYGGTPSVSEGIISAIGRSLPGSSGTLTNLLQTDAAINPGNSGGPLVDTAGRVVGIDTAIATGTSSEPAVNIGFAIPSNAITAELPALIAGQSTGTAYLGVGLADTGPAVIGQVAEGSPAANAGLQPGDTITKIDGKSIASSSDAVGVIGADKPGQTITLTITGADGGSQQVQATLGTKPTTD